MADFLRLLLFFPNFRMFMPNRLLIALLVSLSLPAVAHEFIVKPSKANVPTGGALGYNAVSSHKFMVSEELEDAADVKAEVYSNGKRTPLTLATAKDSLSFEGQTNAPAGTFMLLGQRTGQIWANTPDGVKRNAGKVPGATNVRFIEKYSKAIVNASTKDDTFDKPVGDRLEIIPLTNPASVKVGDEITVKVLYKGQPLATNVWATYDGFSKRDNTYAYFTEGSDDGTATVKLTKPGMWMVRVEHSTPETSADYSRYVGRAVLVFAVK